MTKEEFYLVWRFFNPDAPREQYDLDWEGFLEWKAIMQEGIGE